MKKWVKAVVGLFCSFALIWGAQIEANAEEDISTIEVASVILEEDDELEINDNSFQIQDDSVALNQNQIDVLKNESEEEIEAAIEDDILELAEEENEISIFSGTITDYLTSTNDYDLYSVPLSPGNYLQASLTVPSDININYDLLLYDADLNLIKYSDYLTVLDGYGPLADSIGYISLTEQTMYLCVYSVDGGSASLSYSLDFSISSQNIDTVEPDENVKEATQLNLGSTGATVTRIIGSALDSDWYKFTVQDNPGYTKVRFQLTPNTATGLIKFEVYKNLVTNANVYAMANVVSGDGGEKEFDPGDYYIRVVSTKDINTFTTDDIVSYQLKVTPSTMPTSLSISSLNGHNGNDVTYNGITLYRIERDTTGNYITIFGRATYRDNYGALRGAANVIINGYVENTSWTLLDNKANADDYGSAITDENGYYKMSIHLHSGVGHMTAAAPKGTHHYDLMNVYVSVYQNEKINASTQFYFYQFTV